MCYLKLNYVPFVINCNLFSMVTMEAEEKMKIIEESSFTFDNLESADLEKLFLERPLRTTITYLATLNDPDVAMSR